MKAKKATTAIFIDKWHPRQNGICSVSIRVTHNRQKKYFPTNHGLTPGDFLKVMGSKPRGEFKDIAMNLQAYEKRAAEIITQLPVFTWEAFEKRYFVNTGAWDSLSSAFQVRATEYREADRIGSAVAYETASISLNRFHPGAKFSDVTPTFLQKYEAWMLKQGKSKTTIGIYLRSLRSLFNSAIADGIISKDLYPFGKRKYEIPTGRNTKKALTIEEVGRIFHYEALPGSTQAMAQDYWLFLYLCNGMNVKDMALLQFKNLQGDVLEFERAKTVRTKRESEPIRVMLSEEALSIISRQGNKPNDPEAFIFPILEKGLSADRVHTLIQQRVHLINDHMKDIAKTIGIAKDVTTYVARHSFATIMQRGGASIEFIGEALGHGNTKTTQNYLAGFEDDHKREMAKALTTFKQA